MLRSCELLGLAFGDCPTVALLDGVGILVGFAAAGGGADWAKAKPPDSRTSAIVAQRRFMV